jgi:peptidoglycan/LPS O-acetylase OafA/YrhL
LVAPERTQRIRLLDSLRGLAALVVVLHHTCTLFPQTLRALALHAPRLAFGLKQVGRFNTEAVLLFFVLSGFSIRLSVVGRGLATRAALAHYARRRIARILPAYWFALLLSGVIATWLAPVPPLARSWTTLCGNLLFLQTAVGVPGAWFLPYAGNGALWSLSFEMFYYAAFPLLVRALPERRQRLGWVLASCIVAHAVSRYWPNPFAMFVASGPIWYFGVELAELYLGACVALAWPLFAGLLLLLWASQQTGRALQFYGLWVGSLLYLGGVALIRVAPHLARLARCLRRPLLEPLARAGDLSYALYLLHVPILRALAATLGDRPLSILSALALSLLVSHVTEVAARRWTG